MIVFCRNCALMTAIPVLWGILFAALPVQAYEGVIAPLEGAVPAKNSAAPKNDGYSGVVAPSDGKIPAPEDFGGSTPVERAPEMSLAPGTYATLPSPKSLNDLVSMSMIYAHDKDMDGIPDDLDTSFRLPPQAAKILAQPQYREGGMLPREAMTKRTIDYLLKSIKESKSADARASSVKLAKETLVSLQKGMRAKKSIPKEVWQKMGLPDAYVKEAREGDEKSLARISDALKELSAYE